jgi:small conductance mechanosensitive channel
MLSVAVAAVDLVAQSDAAEVDACGPEEGRSKLCEVVFRATDSKTAADVADALSKPLRIFLIVVIAYGVNRLIRFVIRRTTARLAGESTQERLLRLGRRASLGVLAPTETIPSARRAQRAETIGVVLRSIATFVVWTVAVLLILDTLGVDLAPLVAGAGLIGVAVGFGCQKLVQDFTSGLFMIVEDQFGVGDVIDVGDVGGTVAGGTVEGISLRVTRIRDVEGVLWHVPNGEIRRVANRSQKWARAVLDIDVAYTTDIAHAKRAILDTALAMYEEPEWKDREILEAPEVWGVEAVAPDAVSIRVVVKTAPLEQWTVARELRQRIKETFDREGIEVPMAQRTMWVRPDGAHPPAVAEPEDDS